MRQVRWASWMVGMAFALAVGGVRPVAADIRSDQAAAILEWPSVVFFGPSDVLPVFGVSGVTLNTVIQLTNTSSTAVFAHCFYESANSHCTNTGEVCEVAEQCCTAGTGCGICLPQWNETDFNIQLTPFQPLGWLASDGMAGFDSPPSFVLPLPIGVFPLPGLPFGVSPIDGTSSNAGSRIPPVPESPFNGSLRCIAVDDTGAPVDRNVLKGEASIELFIPADSPVTSFDDDVLSVAKHNAIGIQAIPGAVNDDNILTLGGPTPEYNGCPNFLILNTFFDGADDPVADDGTDIFTALTLVPCTQDFLRQIPGQTTVQYLVYNEFETRFSTSQPVKCKALELISNIDTTQNERSIFFVGNEGTLSGQVRIHPLDEDGFSGLLGVATEIHVPESSDAPVVPLADFNLHYQGDRNTADTITLP